jgi:DNA-binding CsgD family transcriptional regulator
MRRVLMARASATAAMLNDSWQTRVFEDATAALGVDPSLDTKPDRQLFASMALGMVFADAPAEQAAGLALRSLDGVRLVAEETSDSNLLYGVTGVLAWADLYDEELVVLDAALADARRRGSVMGNATATYCRGCVWWRRGDMRRAIADLEHAVRAAEVGWRMYHGVAQSGLVACLADAGRVEEARRQFDAIDLDVCRPTMMWSMVQWARLSLLDAEGADAVAAAAEAERARRELTRNPAISDAWVRAVELYVRADRRDDALEVLDEVRPRAERWGAPRTRAMLRMCDGLVVNELVDVRSAFREAIDLLSSLDAGLELARAHLAYAHRLEALDAHVDEVRDHTSRALDVARRAGAGRIADQAGETLERIGGSQDRRQPGTSLTPSELRVAELAATGMSNREIAQTLFVTIKAVEWHLSNAYRKLDIRGRGELAAVLHRA